MRFDIFCDIVDNYGDAGVCWRLARRLAQTSPIHKHDSIRLFCNDLELLNQLAGGDAKSVGMRLNIQILPWNQARLEPSSIPDVVIEAFGCTLPEQYLSELKKHPDSMLINLEYLSAEEWIDSHHGLPSQSNGINKYFFFPGFSEKSGGLLKGELPNKESSIPLSLVNSWKHILPNSLNITLFCYDTPEIQACLDQLCQQNQSINLLVCYGQAQKAVCKFTGLNLTPEQANKYKNLNIIPLPFVSQDDFDWLLAQCDLNVVRGEDSFVRAQWAGSPFVWQIYPQSDDAHIAKLNAFVNKYLDKADLETQNLAQALMNWRYIALSKENFEKLKIHANAWKNHLLKLHQNGDLAVKLRDFIKTQSKIK